MRICWSDGAPLHRVLVCFPAQSTLPAGRNFSGRHGYLQIMAPNFGPGTTRRELLKLRPVLLLGAFALPSLRDRLLAGGLQFNDAVSGATFRRTHPAPVFADANVAPFENFPYNSFDVVDPGVDLERWRLQVGGAVSRPGSYRLDQVQALPRLRQNTRHICVEGWDVVGRFGGARLSDFLELVGADPTAS